MDSHSSYTSNHHPLTSNKHEALRVLKLAFPYFVEQKYALLALIGLMIITLCLPTIYVIFSYVQRDVYNALQNKNQHDFNVGIRNYILIIVAAVPITVIKNFMTQYICASWRKNMTRKLLREYYSARTFYIIDLFNAVDNPDQRICDDVKNFTATSIKFFLLFSETLMNLFLFSLVLLSIYPYLFFMVLLYSIVGTIITHIIGRALFNLYFTQLTKEANLRFGLIRTRENAESIAFYDENANLEYKNIWTLFQYVYDIQIKVIMKQLHLETFTKSYEYFAFVVPFIILSPSYFAGTLTLGQITQANDAFFNIRMDFSVLVNYYEELSLFSATLYRIECLVAVMDKHHHKQMKQNDDTKNDSSNSKNGDNDSANHGNGSSDYNNSNGSGKSTSILFPQNEHTEPPSVTNSSIANNMTTAVASKLRNVSNRHLYAPLVDDDIESSTAVVVTSSSSLSALQQMSHIITEYRKYPVSVSSSADNASYSKVILECKNICISTPDNRILALKIVSQQLLSEYQNDSSLLLQYQHPLEQQPQETLENTSTGQTNYSPPVLFQPSASSSLYQQQQTYSAYNNSPRMNSPRTSAAASASSVVITTPSSLTSDGISFRVYKGESMLISGPSGCGKSSLLRTLAGLWNKGSGRIVWNDQHKKAATSSVVTSRRHDTNKNSNDSSSNNITHHRQYQNNNNQEYSSLTVADDDEDNHNHHNHRNHHHKYSPVFFLPQKPFSIIGTLRQNIMYPYSCYSNKNNSNDRNDDIDDDEENTIVSGSESTTNNTSRKNNNSNNNTTANDDEGLSSILQQVGLESLVTRSDYGLDTVNDWSKILSVGEAQRIGFARVIYHQPTFVLLDESTSAMDIDTERKLYELLKINKIDYLSIGHRPSLIALHDKHITVLSAATTTPLALSASASTVPS